MCLDRYVTLSVAFKGEFKISVLSKNPERRKTITCRNIITDNALKTVIRLLFSSLSDEKFGFIAIGTGTAPESKLDTALKSEIARKQASVYQRATNVDGDTALLTASFSKSDGLTGVSMISEVGVFNSDVGGTMLTRRTISGIPLNWDEGDHLVIRYIITVVQVT